MYEPTTKGAILDGIKFGATLFLALLGKAVVDINKIDRNLEKRRPRK